MKKILSFLSSATWLLSRSLRTASVETSLTVVDTLQTCVPIDEENLISGSPPCWSAGNESALIPIYLTGADSAGDRALKFRVTSLPSYGWLYHATSEQEFWTSESTLIQAHEDIFPNGNRFAFLIYKSKSFYFNRVSYDNGETFVYKNLENQGIDGCIGFGSCRCSIKVAFGCPDTFTYRVLADDNEASQEGVYHIFVNGQASPFSRLIWPGEFKAKGGTRVDFSGENKITIIDMDDNAYLMSIVLDAGPGKFEFPEGFLKEHGIEISFEEHPCASNTCLMTIYSTPEKLNLALLHLSWTFAGQEGAAYVAKIDLYKPFPNGITQENKHNPDSNAHQRQITVLIDIPEQHHEPNHFACLVIVGVLAFLGTCSFFSCVHFCCKDLRTCCRLRYCWNRNIVPARMGSNNLYAGRVSSASNASGSIVNSANNSEFNSIIGEPRDSVNDTGVELSNVRE